MHAPFRDLRQRFNLKDSDRILDVGGSSAQVTEVPIDTLADIVHPSEFPHGADPILRAKQFVQVDICRDSLPFADKTFDFCLCNHVLEDLYDPRNAIAELGRVANRGLFVTPSRGREMQFTNFDLTDWLTGGSRVPGHAHHHWFFELLNGEFVCTPKHYPLLYTPEFHVKSWLGDQECVYAWEGEPKLRFWGSVNFRDLLADYQRFVAENRHRIIRRRVLFWIDRPMVLAKAHLRRMRRIGNAYVLK